MELSDDVKKRLGLRRGLKSILDRQKKKIKCSSRLSSSSLSLKREAFQKFGLECVTFRENLTQFLKDIEKDATETEEKVKITPTNNTSNQTKTKSPIKIKNGTLSRKFSDPKKASKPSFINKSRVLSPTFTRRNSSLKNPEISKKAPLASESSLQQQNKALNSLEDTLSQKRDEDNLSLFSLELKTTSIQAQIKEFERRAIARNSSRAKEAKKAKNDKNDAKDASFRDFKDSSLLGKVCFENLSRCSSRERRLLRDKLFRNNKDEAKEGKKWSGLERIYIRSRGGEEVKIPGRSFRGVKVRRLGNENLGKSLEDGRPGFSLRKEQGSFLDSLDSSMMNQKPSKNLFSRNIGSLDFRRNNRLEDKRISSRLKSRYQNSFFMESIIDSSEKRKTGQFGTQRQNTSKVDLSTLELNSSNFDKPRSQFHTKRSIDSTTRHLQDDPNFKTDSNLSKDQGATSDLTLNQQETLTKTSPTQQTNITSVKIPNNRLISENTTYYIDSSSKQIYRLVSKKKMNGCIKRHENQEQEETAIKN